VSDCVNAMVEAKEPTTPQPPMSPMLVQANPPKLLCGDDTVLASSDRRHFFVDRGAKVAHRATKSTHPPKSPPSHDLYAQAPELHAALTGAGA
jgi:hypothetical protein